MIRVIIVEDQTMFCDSLRLAIDSQPDMEVVATLADASEALDVASECQPNIILMDIRTKNNASGIAATNAIKQALPAIKVIVMTASVDAALISRTKRAGAECFVYKSTSIEDLLSVIRAASCGYSVFPAAPETALTKANLTAEEMVILRLTCESKSRKEIADELYMSEGTLKRRVSEILDKTGFDSMVHLAMYAIGEGLITLNIED